MNQTNKTRILVIDDEQGILDSLSQVLTYEGYEVTCCSDGESGLKAVSESRFDLIISDIKMPGIDGIEVLEKLRDMSGITVPVIVISGHATISTAVEATRKGAFDLLEKPLDRDRILLAIKNALHSSALQRENLDLKAASVGMLGQSKAFRELRQQLEQAGLTERRVLLCGENGTGKELAARYLHLLSARKNQPFVEVNCAAIPDNLIESELFGHKKGAFTGADTDRTGKFEAAHNGTLFLDEIGDMSLAAQAKVLRALETGAVQRVGEEKAVQVNVRVISATNKDLQQSVAENKFREDLFYRLNVIPIRVPLLRERKEDIPLLAREFMSRVCSAENLGPRTLSDQALAILGSCEWPGNVRQLHNTVERIAVMSTEDEISAETVRRFLDTGSPSATHNKPQADSGLALKDYVEQAESDYIRKHLDAHSWNVKQTADALCIPRSNLYKKMEKYGIKR